MYRKCSQLCTKSWNLKRASLSTLYTVLKTVFMSLSWSLYLQSWANIAVVITRVTGCITENKHLAHNYLGYLEIARLRDNVTTAHQWETIPNIWNGTMFSDLYWRINAARRFSAIAEFPVFLCGQKHLNKKEKVRNTNNTAVAGHMPCKVQKMLTAMYKVIKHSTYRTSLATFSDITSLNISISAFPVSDIPNSNY